jgi:hypothetical protein
MSEVRGLQPSFGVGCGWGWVAAFWGLLQEWTRLPEKHWWQVGLTLLVPLLMHGAMLVLEAGTMRALTKRRRQAVRRWAGRCTFLVWVAVVWACWFILDWCDDQIPLWASYLNSQASAHARARLFTYEHLQRWFTMARVGLRWIIVPAKVIPHAMSSAQWGWRSAGAKLCACC